MCHHHYPASRLTRNPSGHQHPQNTPFIGTLDEAPEFFHANPYILRGYRINFDSPVRVMKSLFMLHNETVNIWLHLIPACITLLLILSLCVRPRNHEEVLISNNEIGASHMNDTQAYRLLPVNQAVNTTQVVAYS